MIKFFGILKIVMSIILLTYAPLLFFGSLSPASEGKLLTFISMLLVPYGCYLFYSGQTQFMRLNVKHPTIIMIGAISGLAASLGLIFYFPTIKPFLIASVVLIISIQDVFRIKSRPDAQSTVDSVTLDNFMKD